MSWRRYDYRRLPLLFAAVTALAVAAMFGFKLAQEWMR